MQIPNYCFRNDQKYQLFFLTMYTGHCAAGSVLLMAINKSQELFLISEFHRDMLNTYILLNIPEFSLSIRI